MGKIREKLIHLLGGFTSKDVDNNIVFAKRVRIYQIKKYADQLYGLSADEWCAKMYEYITEAEKEYGNERKNRAQG